MMRAFGCATGEEGRRYSSLRKGEARLHFRGSLISAHRFLSSSDYIAGPSLPVGPSHDSQFYLALDQKSEYYA